jgi:thioesterase domain-containing protein
MRGCLSYGWGAALGKPVRVIEVPGDHLGILKAPHVDELARRLRAELKALEPSSSLNLADIAANAA